MKYTVETWEWEGKLCAKIRILDDTGKCCGAQGVDPAILNDVEAVQKIKDALALQAATPPPAIETREI